ILLVASKVFNKYQLVLGVDTDPERSEGHLCLPVCNTHAFPEALQKLRSGQLRWQWRQRIRLHLEGTGIKPTPVDLHEQQLSLEQHNQAHRITLMEAQRSTAPQIILVCVLIYRSYNINKLVEQAVEDVLRIGKFVYMNLNCLLSVTDEYESLVFGPEEGKMFFSIREPIVNRVFSSSCQRGFWVCVCSRCWDACMVVNGGTSFEFNDGAIATITINEEDQLRTVLLKLTDRPTILRAHTRPSAAVIYKGSWD
uniref:NAD kinase 2, mitochondrial n=1 Tax=Salmo trutta TaxID=8032 RepID=A0A673ZN68_SALTR